jgi:hypothetical protein
MKTGRTSFELDRNPRVGIYPLSLDAVVVFVDGNGHVLAGIDNLQASIFHVRFVYRE